VTADGLDGGEDCDITPPPVGGKSNYHVYRHVTRYDAV